MVVAASKLKFLNATVPFVALIGKAAPVCVEAQSRLADGARIDTFDNLTENLGSLRNTSFFERLTASRSSAAVHSPISQSRS